MNEYYTDVLGRALGAWHACARDFKPFFQLLGKTQMPLVSRRSGNGRSGGGGGSSGSGGGGGVGGCGGGGGGGRRNARVLVQRNYKLFSRIHPRSGS